MPTVLNSGPYRFFFYSEEGNEPPHIHIEAAEKRAKFWLTPIEQTWNDGFRSGELKTIENLITANIHLILEAWYAFFPHQ
ncbi:MAG: DUF4160 domain-containing protein [Acidobacteriaceae bacterium]